jgi:S-layer protein
MAMPAPTVQQAIDGLYITLYNRVADAFGLSGWAGYLNLTAANAATATATLAEFESLATQFIAVESITSILQTSNSYYTVQYGGTTNQQFVQDLYLNLGGPANQAGIQSGVTYWTGLLNGGESRGQLVGDFVNAFLTYNTTGDAAGTARQQTLLNKDLVSDYYIKQSTTNAFLQATTTTSTAFQAEIAVVANVTSSAASVTAAEAEINAAVATQSLNPILNPTSSPTTGNLTTGPDASVLSGNNNVIAGTFNTSGSLLPTFSTGDQIIVTGGGTGNVINLTDNNSNPSLGFVVPTATSGVTVGGVQTANFVANEALILNTSSTSSQGWTGLTALNVTTISGNAFVDSITVAPTTAVTVIDTNIINPLTAQLTINGGSNVSISESNGFNNAGETISVNNVSGPAVSVTQTLANNSTAYQAVFISDVNYGKAAAGTVTTVALSGLGGVVSTVRDSGLATLTINNAVSGAVVGLNNGGFTTGATTLNLTLSNNAGLTLRDQSTTSAYTSVAVTTGATGSSITDMGFSNVTSETVAGSSALTQTDIGASSIKSIAISGAAGFTDLGLNTSATLTSVTTSSSGAVTVNLNAAQTSFVSTGSGQDYVTISQDASKAITGGTATNNEIVLNAAASAFTAANAGANVTGFEILGTGANSSGNYILSGTGAILAKDTALTGIDVIANSAGQLTFSQVIAGTSLSVDASVTQAITYQTVDAAGPTDSLTATLASGISLSNAAGLTLEDSTFQGIGNVTFNTLGSTAASIAQLNDSNLSQLTISGAGVDIQALKDAGATLTVIDSSNNSFGFGDTAVDAANFTTLSFTESGSGTLSVGPAGGFTEASLTSLTLKGLVAVPTLTDSSTSAVTVTGGTDNANVELILTGAKSVTDSITLGNGVDGVHDNVNTGTVNITLGNGNGVSYDEAWATNAAHSTISVGSGFNSVMVGTGATPTAAGVYASTITIAAHLTTVEDYIQLGATNTAATTTNNTTPTNFAVISGLNSTAGGSDSIGFSGDGLATGAVTQVLATTVGAYAQAQHLDPTQLLTWVAASLDTVAHGGGGVAQHGIASFQFQGNTYLVEQSQATGVTTLGGNDTIVELTGLVNVTVASSATVGVLHLLG